MTQPFDFDQKNSEVSEQYNIGTELFNFQEGNNIVRILTGYEVVAQHFCGKGEARPTCFGEDKGCPYHEKNEDGELKYPLRIRCIFWLLDRRDKRVKLAFMPYTFANQLAQLQRSEEYGFTEVPMAYDVCINAQGAGSKEVLYATSVERNEYFMVPVEADTITELMTKKTPEAVAEGMKGRAKNDAEMGIVYVG